jgi:hypothetical protein
MRVKLDRIVSTRTRATPAAVPDEQERRGGDCAKGGEGHGPAAPDQSYYQSKQEDQRPRRGEGEKAREQ